MTTDSVPPSFTPAPAWQLAPEQIEAMSSQPFAKRSLLGSLPKPNMSLSVTKKGIGGIANFMKFTGKGLSYLVEAPALAPGIFIASLNGLVYRDRPKTPVNGITVIGAVIAGIGSMASFIPGVLIRGIIGAIGYGLAGLAGTKTHGEPTYLQYVISGGAIGDCFNR